MRVIIPMAGKGSRLRPHTLTTPKPLIPVAGKPIVQRLVEDIARILPQRIEQVVFIIGDFGKEVENDLLHIASNLGAEGIIYYQLEPLGTAHALYTAKESLEGPIIIAFADTLFKADFKLDTSADGVIWVKKVENPSAFGVVRLDEYGYITDFVEKPKEFVSDLAIIGVYYFKCAKTLLDEIRYLIENNIKDNGEFQLTNALDNMRAKGKKFTLGKVDDWMDCGNKNSTVETNARILEYEKDLLMTYPASAKITNSLIIPPCYIGDDVEISNSKIGPYVSIGKGTKIFDSNISNSLIQEKTIIVHGNLENSMIGNYAEYYGVSRSLSLGDFSVLDFQLKK